MSFLKNHWANFNQPWQKATFNEGEMKDHALFQGEEIMKWRNMDKI